MQEISIYSSYYARAKSLACEGILYVQVSNTAPDWFPYELLNVSNMVAPTWLLITQYRNGDISFDKFSEQYKQSLNLRISKEEFVNKLYVEAEERNCNTIVLLCWEKEDDKCHRSALGEWLGNNFKYEL